MKRWNPITAGAMYETDSGVFVGNYEAESRIRELEAERDALRDIIAVLERAVKRHEADREIIARHSRDYPTEVDRLHALNAELLEALKSCYRLGQFGSHEQLVAFSTLFYDAILDVIAKSEAQNG